MRLFACVLAAIVAASTAVVAQRSPGADCDILWEQRNMIFSNAGYCFKTADAIQRFGNAGCRYDDVRDVPLSSRDRQVIANLQALERRHGCPR